MATFLLSKYGYVFDDLVQVRVSARNSFGWGAASSIPLTTGARVRTIPSKMTSPVDIVA